MKKWIQKISAALAAAALWLSVPVYAQEPAKQPVRHLEIQLSGPGEARIQTDEDQHSIGQDGRIQLDVKANQNLVIETVCQSGAVLDQITENGTSLFEESVPSSWTYTMPDEDVKLQLHFSEEAPQVQMQKDDEKASVPVNLMVSAGGSVQVRSPFEKSVQADFVQESAREGSSFQARILPQAGYQVDTIALNHKAYPVTEAQKSGLSIEETIHGSLNLEVVFARIQDGSSKDPYQQAYEEAFQIYPGNVNDLLWDNQLYQEATAGLIPIAQGDARNYMGSIGNAFHTVTLVSNNNVPIKNIDIARMYINDQDAFCINPLGVFQNGPKVRLDINSVLTPQTIQECSLAKYYVENSQAISGKTYGVFSQKGSNMQYMIIQCIIYRILSFTEPGMSFGNSHITMGGNFSWEDQVNLISDAESFAERNTNNYTGYGGAVYVTSSLNHPSQPGVTFDPPKKIEYGSLQLQKSSASPDLTQNNPLYSLEGAEFQVTNAAGQPVGTLKTDASGVSNTLSGLALGQYTITETKAPKGFAIDTKAVKVIVQANQTASAQFPNTPQRVPVDLLVVKKDALDQRPVEGAQFVFHYYPVNMDTDPASAGKKPLRTWTLKTDANGQIKMDEAHKVSGSPFYTENGKPVLPLGTLTIQEVKAPDGYVSDSRVLVKNLQSKDTAADLNVYSTAEVTNKPIELKVIKKQQTTDVPLAGVQFEHQDPKGKTETLKTDENGQMVLSRLKAGQHVLQEQDPLPGYKPLEQKIVFNVSSDGTIKLEDHSQAVLKKEGLIIENSPQNPSLEILKENNLNEKLEGAKFALYTDEACSEEAAHSETNEEGLLLFEHLENGKTYYLKETKAPDHHEMETDEKGESRIWKITPNIVPAQNIYAFAVNETMVSPDQPAQNLNVSVDEQTGAARLHLIVKNKLIESKLPSTGGSGMTSLVLLGASLAALGGWFWYFERRKANSAQ